MRPIFGIGERVTWKEVGRKKPQSGIVVDMWYGRSNPIFLYEVEVPAGKFSVIQHVVEEKLLSTTPTPTPTATREEQSR